VIGRAVLLLAVLGLSGCGSVPIIRGERPTLAVQTQSLKQLLNMPDPASPVYVAVYGFTDQTGQHKPNDTYADYSFAVTQGGTSILMNALYDVDDGKWFDVLERNRLPDLLQEREIIRANRLEFSGPQGAPLPPLGPLHNAGIIMEGGIIGYDSNLLTGGFGANYLGIGASTQYRKDTVAVYLRTVSVLTGDVLTSVVANKTIYSVEFDGSVNEFVGFNKLLQVETGFSTNEPAQLAVKQAIEEAVYATVMEGAIRHYWSFADPAEQATMISEYEKTEDGDVVPPVDFSSAGAPEGDVKKES